MNEETRNTAIGALTLLVLAALAAISFAPASVEKVGGFDVSGDFNKVDGLTIGDEVLLSGIQIGEVSGMALLPDYRARLTLRINDGVKLPADSDARILTNGLFGSKFIEVNPGADEQNLEQGDSISITQESIVLQDLLELVISQGKAAQAKKGKPE